jgi:tRNA-dihydrouridine synthase C
MMLSPSAPALVFAPMQGVTDAPMRAMQGATGAFAFAVSEFLRVSRMVPPKRVFVRQIPELLNRGLTPTGLPVQVQLLGGDPGRMAQAAATAYAAGARAIDVNFGCPAPTVNRHDGGATLLQYPKRIREIVAAIRTALPSEVPVSAKMRLGWDCTDSIDENAEMAAEGGVAWLTIHARTRLQGYAPPVHWRAIGRVRERLGIPIVANGDIWTVEGFRQCRDETGCQHFMLGRGALADPNLACRIAVELDIVADRPTIERTQRIDWHLQLQNLIRWTPSSDQHVDRLKQWLKLAAMFGDFEHFEVIKRSESVDELLASLKCAA